MSVALEESVRDDMCSQMELEDVDGQELVELVKAIRCSLLCPLCGRLMSSDCVFLQMCGHGFCSACINVALEKGYVETRLLCEVREVLGVERREAVRKRKRPRARTFCCPICETPAHKWTLSPGGVVNALCCEMARMCPNLEQVLSQSACETTEIEHGEGHTSPPVGLDGPTTPLVSPARSPSVVQSMELFGAPDINNDTINANPLGLPGADSHPVTFSSTPGSDDRERFPIVYDVGSSIGFADGSARLRGDDMLVKVDLADSCLSRFLRIELCTRAVSRAAVIGSFEWLGDQTDQGYWCVPFLTPTLCTALVQGMWCLNSSWLSMCYSIRRSPRPLPCDFPTASRYLPLAWKRNGCVQHGDGRHNAFASMQRGVKDCHPGSWIREGRYSILFASDAITGQVVRFLHDAEECSSHASDVADAFRQNGHEDCTTSGFPCDAWRSLVVCAGGTLVELPSSLWGLLVEYVVSQSYQHDFVPPPSGESVEKALASIASHTHKGGQRVHLECSPLAGDRLESLSHETVLLLHNPLSVKWLSSQGIKVDPHMLPDLKELFTRIMRSVAQCVALLLRLPTESKWSTPRTAVDVRTTSWLLSNIAEGRSEAGVVHTKAPPAPLEVPPVAAASCTESPGDNHSARDEDEEETSESATRDCGPQHFRSLLYEDSS